MNWEAFNKRLGAMLPLFQYLANLKLQQRQAQNWLKYDIEKYRAFEESQRRLLEEQLRKAIIEKLTSTVADYSKGQPYAPLVYATTLSKMLPGILEETGLRMTPEDIAVLQRAYGVISQMLPSVQTGEQIPQEQIAQALPAIDVKNVFDIIKEATSTKKAATQRELKKTELAQQAESLALRKKELGLKEKELKGKKEETLKEKKKRFEKLIDRKREIEREIIAFKESPETAIKKGGREYLSSLKAEWNETVRELNKLAKEVGKKFMSVSEHRAMARKLLREGVINFGNIFNSERYIDRLYNEGYDLLTLQRVFNELKAKLNKK